MSMITADKITFINPSAFCEISGFRREVDENCVLLGRYATSSGNSVPTFRGNFSVPSSKVNHSWSSKMGPDSSPQNVVKELPLLTEWSLRRTQFPSAFVGSSENVIHLINGRDNGLLDWCVFIVGVWLITDNTFIYSLVFSPRGRSGRNQSPIMESIWLLAHCILGKFLGVVCHCFPPPLDVPTFATTCLCVRSDARDPSCERWNCGRERCPVVILRKFRHPLKFVDLLHAANLQHGTDGFTSPPKDFFRPGLNPRTWVPKANTLPLGHRSRLDST